jgi:hypothetical protein
MQMFYVFVVAIKLLKTVVQIAENCDYLLNSSSEIELVSYFGVESFTDTSRKREKYGT